MGLWTDKSLSKQPPLLAICLLPMRFFNDARMQQFSFIPQRLHRLDPCRARNAGRKQASNATTKRSKTAMVMMIGSVGLTSKSWFLKSRVSQNAVSSPMAAPIPARCIPSVITSFNTCQRSAPSAIRMPSSCGCAARPSKPRHRKCPARRAPVRQLQRP